MSLAAISTGVDDIVFADRCGPQHRFKTSPSPQTAGNLSHTVLGNGWTITSTSMEDVMCILTTLGRKPEETVLHPERDLPTSFRYDDDNTQDYESLANPANDGLTKSHMNIIADLTAAMAEYSMNSGINSSTAMRNIIVTAEKKQE
ncbi:hypothetical protein OUZ56_011651 [Daphnia magna]|uniref:Uncharacterized protein n=1 Tax=Daphnia magna TaxID=35525 RepID=A0ABQ9Z0R2_9CRUS|nr:hypothetical protein OUZ56_011651 [Daphnia magna]